MGGTNYDKGPPPEAGEEIGMNKRIAQVMVGVVLVAFGFVTAAFAQERPPVIAYTAGTVVTGDNLTAVGNLNVALYEFRPGVEAVLSVGAGLLQPAGPANNVTTTLGGGVSFWRYATVGAAWDTQADRFGLMVLGDVNGLLNALQGNPSPSEQAVRPKASTPATLNLQGRINRGPARAL